jgi:hypothetical protein
MRNRAEQAYKKLCAICGRLRRSGPSKCHNVEAAGLDEFFQHS